MSRIKNGLKGVRNWAVKNQPYIYLGLSVSMPIVIALLVTAFEKSDVSILDVGISADGNLLVALSNGRDMSVDGDSVMKLFETWAASPAGTVLSLEDLI